MGLDMYLSKVKRIGEVNLTELSVLNEYFSYISRPSKYRDTTMKQWNGLDMKDVNLDLVEDYIPEYKKRYAAWDNEKEYGNMSLFQSVGYWRKANQIHNWFVGNVQDGVDNCGKYEVTKEQLEELKRTCEEVLKGSRLTKGKIVNGQHFESGKWVDCYEDGKYIENPSVAMKLLPTVSGFFFGNTHYDQWYYADLVDTVETINEVLRTTDFEHEIVMYQASW